MARCLLRNSATGHRQPFLPGLGTPSPGSGRCAIILLSAAFLLLPLPAFGVITFERSFSFVPGHDAAGDIIQTPDGGYLVSGTCWVEESLGWGYARIALAKLDSLGSIEWTRINDAGELWCAAYGGLATSADSHYFVAGACIDFSGGISDAIVLKVKSSNGVVIWKYHYYGPGWDWFYGVVPTPDGGCIACGTLTTEDSAGVGVMRFDRDGNPLWRRIYDPIPESLNTTGGTIVLMPDGGCAINGGIYADGWWDLTMRIDSTGGLLWQVIDTTAPDCDYIYGDISLTPTGNIAVCGLYCGSNNPGDSFGGYVKVFSPNGERLLNKLVMVRYNPGVPPYPQYVFFRGGKSTPDGGFVMVGDFFPEGSSGGNQRTCLVRLDDNGDSVWARLYGPDIGEYGWSVINTRDGGFAVLGEAPRLGGPLYVFKTDSLGMIYSPAVSEEKEQSVPKTALEVLPNPLSGSARLRFSVPAGLPVRILVVDESGRMVANLFAGIATQGELLWHPKGLAQGVYFIRLETPGSVLTQRTLLLR